MSFAEIKYLLGIFTFKKENISLLDLSKHLNVKAPSSHEMLKKMESKNLITYSKTLGVRLTTEGLTEANRFSFRYRYWEKNIKKLLGKANIDYDDIMSLMISENLDMEISAEIEKAIFGDISGANLFKKCFIGYFDEMKENFYGVIDSIDTNIIGLETACKKKGIERGKFIKLISKSPFDNSWDIQLGEKTITLSHKITSGLILSSKEVLIFNEYLEKEVISSTFNATKLEFKKLNLKAENLVNLAKCNFGYIGVIQDFENINEEEKKFLEKKGLLIGKTLKIIDKSDFDGFVEVLLNETNKISFSSEMASKIWCSNLIEK